MLAVNVWSSCGPLWSEEDVLDRVFHAGGVHPWMWVLQRSACLSLKSTFSILTFLRYTRCSYTRYPQRYSRHRRGCHHPSFCSYILNYLLIGANTNPFLQIGILAQAFPPSRARSIAFATFAAGAPIGAALGTALGGLLAEMTAYVRYIILKTLQPFNFCDQQGHLALSIFPGMWPDGTLLLRRVGIF
jgi:hypothetical protein